MSRLFALDSTIVIILAGGHSAESRARERAEGILLEHEDSRELIGVPAAGWAECCHCDAASSNSFIIWSLNPAAAILANRLTAPMLKLGQAKGNTKRAVKIDALILATAEIVGCVGLYTTDDWFEDIAKREGLRVEVLPLPPIRPMQTNISDLNSDDPADGEPEV